MADGFVTQLTEILAAHGAIESEDTAAIIEAFRGHVDYAHFEDFLLEEGIVNKDVLLEALGAYYGRPAIDVMGELCNNHYVQMFPESVLAQYNFVPLRRDGDVMIFAAGDPTNDELERIVGEYVSYDPEFFPGIPQHIRLLARQCHDESLWEETTETKPSVGMGEETTETDPKKEDILEKGWEIKRRS